MSLPNVTILCFAASYALALLLELRLMARPNRGVRLLQQAMMLAGLTAHALYASRLALSESAGSATLIFLSLILAVFAFSGSFHYGRFAWSLFVLPVVLALIAIAWVRPEGPTSGLTPGTAERAWMALHIAFILLGFVGLCVGFLSSVMYLLQAQRLKAKTRPDGGLRLLSLERLEAMNRRSMLIAFPLLTSGLLLGFLLMNQTKQLPWSDPKVLATLPVWVVVGLLLLLRYGLHSHARRLAWISLLCFFLMLLSIGVPWFWPSAHPTGAVWP